MSLLAHSMWSHIAHQFHSVKPKMQHLVANVPMDDVKGVHVLHDVEQLLHQALDLSIVKSTTKQSHALSYECQNVTIFIVLAK